MNPQNTIDSSDLGLDTRDFWTNNEELEGACYKFNKLLTELESLRWDNPTH